MKRIPVFPEININRYSNRIEFETKIRLQDEKGQWYFSIVSSTHQFEKNAEVPSIGELTSWFLKNVYISMLFGKASEHIVNTEGEPIYEKDQEQIDERERIKKLMPWIVD